MEFLYRYYYVFFVLHARDVTKGIKSGPAWIATLFQLSIGLVLLLFGVVIILAEFAGYVENLKGGNPYIFGLVASTASFFVTRYLLFNYYKVSFETGRTENSDFTITQPWRYFFWVFWLLSVSLPFFASLYVHGYSLSNF